MSHIIAGFPGIGKSTLTKLLPAGYACDADSGNFSKNLFPDNYIKHIDYLTMKNVPIIFTSSHEEVRNVFDEQGYVYSIVFPNKKLKDHYIKRYKTRGSKSEFIDYVADNWNDWIDSCKNSKNFKIELRHVHETLADVYTDIVFNDKLKRFF